MWHFDGQLFLVSQQLAYQPYSNNLINCTNKLKSAVTWKFFLYKSFWKCLSDNLKGGNSIISVVILNLEPYEQSLPNRQVVWDYRSKADCIFRFKIKALSLSFHCQPCYPSPCVFVNSGNRSHTWWWKASCAELKSLLVQALPLFLHMSFLSFIVMVICVVFINHTIYCSNQLFALVSLSVKFIVYKGKDSYTYCLYSSISRTSIFDLLNRYKIF